MYSVYIGAFLEPISLRWEERLIAIILDIYGIIIMCIHVLTLCGLV